MIRILYIPFSLALLTLLLVLVVVIIVVVVVVVVVVVFSRHPVIKLASVGIKKRGSRGEILDEWLTIPISCPQRILLY